MALGVVARRTESLLAYIAAGTAMLLAGIAFLSARRTFRRVDLRAEHKRVTAILGGHATTISDVYIWTMDGAARVYDPLGGWSFEDKDGNRLAALLTDAFGSPFALRRRGSDPARYAALVVACAGALSTAAGFGARYGPLVLAGIPLFVCGAAVFGAFSQKVIDDASPRATSTSAGFPE